MDRWRFFLATLALLTVLTAVQTYPQVFQMRDGVADVGDPLLNTWALSWVAHQAPIAPGRIFDANIFYPERWTLAYSEPMLVPALLAAPLAWMGAGPILVYNLVFLAAMICSGLGTALLVLDLTGRRPAAVVSAVIFAFLPFRFDHYSHLQLQQTAFIPLTLWALHRLVRTGRAADGVRLGLFAAGQMLSCVYLGVFLMPYLAAVALVLVAGELRVQSTADDVWVGCGRQFARRVPLAFALAAVVYGAVVAPVGRAHMRASEVVGERSASEAALGSAEPRNYLAAAASNWVYGASTATRFGSDERRLFPGAVAVLLAVIGVARRRSRETVAYAAALLLAFDLSLGFNGLLYPVLWTLILPFRALRVPARMGLFAGFSIAVLAGFGVAWLQERLQDARTRRLVVVALVALICVEYQSRPFGLTRMATEAPAVYGDLLRERGNAPRASMVELPLGQDPTYMYYSTFHWQDLLNGYSGFFPPSYHELGAAMRTFPDDASLAFLGRRGTRFVTVHGEMMEPGEFRRLLAAAEQTPQLKLIARRPWQRSEIALFRLVADASYGAAWDADLRAVAASFSVTFERQAVRVGAPVDVRYAFTPTGSPLTGNYVVMAHFVDAQGRLVWQDDHRPDTPTSSWQPGRSIEYTRTVFVPEALAPGPLTLIVGLYAPDTQVRVPLAGQEVESRGYRAASLQLLPPDRVAYPLGWYDHEGQATDLVRWRWMGRQGTIRFNNPRADASVYLEVEASDQFPAPVHAQVLVGGAIAGEFDVLPSGRAIHRLPVTAAQLGTVPFVDLVIALDRTYSPAELTKGASPDTRQLGIRVFNAALVSVTP